MSLISAMLAISLVIIWLMPKRLTRAEMYVSWAMVTLITTLLDALLGALFHLYYYFNVGIGINDIFQELVTGSYGPIMLNFMPKKFGRFVVYHLDISFFTRRKNHGNVACTNIHSLVNMVFDSLLCDRMLFSSLAFAFHQIGKMIPANELGC